MYGILIFIIFMYFYSGEKESLFDITQEIEGEVARLTDDLDEDDEGYIYWTDASSNAPLKTALIDVLSSPSGRYGIIYG